MAERGRGSIEQEMDEVRQQLAGTIDQLVHRTSPKTIANRQVASVRGYFVDAAGQPRTDNIVKFVGGAAGVLLAMVIIRRVVG